MTQEQAIAAAREFVVRNRRPVQLEPESVRLYEADRFNILFGQEIYPCDFWVVGFRKTVFESPGSVMVEVIPGTGEVREVYVGVWADLLERGARASCELVANDDLARESVLVETIDLGKTS